jgi:hypothetical protein
MGVWFAALLLVLFRFGLLSIALGQFLHFLLGGFPLTTNLGTWYSGVTLLTSLRVVGLAVYGFKVSLSGRPAFRDLLAET